MVFKGISEQKKIPLFSVVSRNGTPAHSLFSLLIVYLAHCIALSMHRENHWKVIKFPNQYKTGHAIRFKLKMSKKFWMPPKKKRDGNYHDMEKCFFVCVDCFDCCSCHFIQPVAHPFSWKSMLRHHPCNRNAKESVRFTILNTQCYASLAVVCVCVREHPLIKSAF